MPQPTVRPATRDDIPHLVDWNCALAQETEGITLDRASVESGVTAVFDKPERGFHLVAESDAEPVGSLLITYEWSDWRNGFYWWIQSVYVVSKARRTGVFRALHEEIVERARAAQAISLRLNVDHANERAKKTYASLGLEPSNYLMYERSFA